MKKPKTSALYARYSSDQQAETSAADQLRLCRARAKAEGFDVVAEFSDEKLSGLTPVGTRPGGKRLLQAAAAREFDILIMEGIDRLSRDTVETETIIRRMEFNGLRIIGISDGYDSDSQTRKINRGMRGLINAIYLDDLAKKTHRGLSGVVSRGHHAGGLPYGYRTIQDGSGHRLEIDQQQAEIVRQIYAWFIQGDGPAKIAAKLNAQAIPGPRGGSWAVSAIYGNRAKGCGILANELYAGRYIWNRSQWIKDPDTGTRKRHDRPSSEWQTRPEPGLAIIDASTWQAALARMEKPTTQGGTQGRAKKPSTLLGGLLKCDECGGPIIAVNATTYGCAHRKDRGLSVCTGVYIKKDTAERRIIGTLAQELQSPESLAKLHEYLRQQLTAHTPAKDQAKRLADVQSKLDHIVEALAMVGTSPALTAKLTQLEAEKLQLEAEKTQTRLEIKEIPQVIQRYKRLLEDLNGVLNTDITKARAILSEILGDVRISKEDGGIYATLKTESRMLLCATSGYLEMVAGTGLQFKIRLDG